MGYNWGKKTLYIKQLPLVKYPLTRSVTCEPKTGLTVTYTTVYLTFDPRLRNAAGPRNILYKYW